LEGDLENICGDRAKPDPDAPDKCPDGSDPMIPPGDERNPQIQAFTTNEMPAKWDVMTFCNQFFGLPSWDEAIHKNSGQPSHIKYNLSKFPDFSKF
jgi:hypothetical protein